MSKNNLRIRLLKGILANGLGQITTVMIQVVSLPIFLHSWGKDLYGEWLILSAIPAYLSMSDIGFSTAATNEMTMRVAQGDRATALEVFQSIWLLVSGISFIAAITLIFTAFFMPLERWLNLTHISRYEVIIIVFLLALYVITGMQTSLLTAGFTCDGNYALGVSYTSLVRLIEFGTVTLAVYFSTSPTIAALLFFTVRVIGTIGMRLILSKKSPWIVYSHYQAKFSTIKRLANPAIASLSFPLGNALNNQGIIIAIGSILTPADVVVFSTLRTLSRLALQLMGIIKNTISPEISSAYALKNIALARNLHRRACQVSLWLSLFVVLGLIVAGNWIVKIWTQGEITIDYSLFYLMLTTVVISSFWYTSFAVISAINQHKKLAIWYLSGNFVSLTIAVYTMPSLGLDGAGISLLIVDTLMSVLVIRTSLILVEDDFKKYLLFLLYPLKFT